MAKRRTKKRTHVGARNPVSQGTGKASAGGRSPKSMVLRIGAGEVGPSVSQLVKDVRAMMEPDTASRLKVNHTFPWIHLLCIYANAPEGTKIQQVKRLSHDGWTTWCNTSAFILTLKYWKHKSTDYSDTAWANFPLQS